MDKLSHAWMNKLARKFDTPFYKKSNSYTITVAEDSNNLVTNFVKTMLSTKSEQSKSPEIRHPFIDLGQGHGWKKNVTTFVGVSVFLAFQAFLVQFLCFVCLPSFFVSSIVHCTRGRALGVRSKCSQSIVVHGMFNACFILLSLLSCVHSSSIVFSAKATGYTICIYSINNGISASSCAITEVKQRWARLLLGLGDSRSSVAWTLLLALKVG